MKIGDYIKFIVEKDENDCDRDGPKGLQYAYIEEIEDDEIKVRFILFPRCSYTFELDDFYSKCAEVTEEEALKVLQGEIKNIDEKINKQQDEEKKLTEEIKILLPGSIVNQEIEQKVTALVPSMNSMDKLVSFGNKLAGYQIDLEKRSASIKESVERMQSLMEVKLNRFQAIVSSVSKVIRKFEKMVWTIEIYLGVKEQIIQLIEGQPADINEKIKIRQRVLFMDEESLLLVEKGGLEFQTIEKFDDWLASDKKYIEALIPEKKGIVVMKPRRKEFKYTDDVRMNFAMNEENKKTYFLIRNGDNVYRIWTDFEIGHEVFLSKKQIDEFFITEERNFETDTRRKKRVTKKDGYEYKKAMRELASYQEQQFKTIMFLAGIVDRTHIFKPFPPELQGFDVLKTEIWNKLVTLIYDSTNLLPTKHQLFNAFQKSINSQIDVGTRIVGFFNDGKRISPKTGEYNGPSYPSSDAIYELEGRRESGLFFKYKDPDWKVYRWKQGLEDSESKVRASYLVYSNDTNIVNYDKITSEDIEYYLSSRPDREFYLDLIPVLTRVKRLKAEEEKIENMFKDLVYNKLNEAYPDHNPKLSDRVDDLVIWWKNYIKIHRPIMKDDSKAYRMIIREYKKRYVETSDFDISSLVNHEVLFIGERANVIYVFSMYYDSIDLVYETRYIYKNNTFIIVKEKFISAFKNRLNVLRLLYTSTDLGKYHTLSRAEDFITAEQRDSLIDFITHTDYKQYLSKWQYEDRKFFDWYDIWVDDFKTITIRWYSVARDSYHDHIDDKIYYLELTSKDYFLIYHKLEKHCSLDYWGRSSDPAGKLVVQNPKAEKKKEIFGKQKEKEKHISDLLSDITSFYCDDLYEKYKNIKSGDGDKKFQLLREKKEAIKLKAEADKDYSNTHDLVHENLKKGILPTDVKKYIEIMEKYSVAIPKIKKSILEKFKEIKDKESL